MSGGPPFLFNQISRIASLAAQRRSLRLQDRNTLLMSSYFSFWLSSKFSCFSLGSVNFRSCCALSFRGCMHVEPMAEVPTIVEVTFAAVQHRPLPVFYLGLLHGGHPSFVYFVHSTSHIVSNWSQLFYRSRSRPIPKMLPGIKLGREDFLPSDWFLGFRILCVPISTSRTEATAASREFAPVYAGAH